jgi:hypothetical protein
MARFAIYAVTKSDETRYFRSLTNARKVSGFRRERGARAGYAGLPISSLPVNAPVACEDEAEFLEMMADYPENIRREAGLS